MSMRQQDSIDAGWSEWHGLPVEKPQLLEPLKETAIDKKPGGVAFQKESGAGDGTGPAVS
jgi:hypothetical protein